MKNFCALLILFAFGCSKNESSIYVELSDPESYLELKSGGVFYLVEDGKTRHGNYNSEDVGLLLRFQDGQAGMAKLLDVTRLHYSSRVWIKCPYAGTGFEYKEFFEEKIRSKWEEWKVFNSITDGMNNIVIEAHQFSIMPSSMGGGGGSYSGYKMHRRLSSDEQGFYTTTVTTDSLIITATGKNLSGEATWTVDLSGRPVRRLYTQDFDRLNRLDSWW